MKKRRFSQAKFLFLPSFIGGIFFILLCVAGYSQGLSDSALSDARIVSNDSTYLFFSTEQLDKVLLTGNDSEFFSPAISGLIGALIGASSAILSQFFGAWISNRNEKKRFKIELITEERRLSILLKERYRELAWLKVSRDFWRRTHSISQLDTDFSEFLSFRDRVPECNIKIVELWAEYSKIITKYIILANDNSTLKVKLETAINLRFLDSEPTNFKNATDLLALQLASEFEVKKLRKTYAKLNIELDSIYYAMINLRNN